jgi:hypothetical protein
MLAAYPPGRWAGLSETVEYTSISFGHLKSLNSGRWMMFGSIYGSIAARQQILQRQRKLENEIRELMVSSDKFTMWLLGFDPEDVVGLAGIPDRDPIVQFVKTRTGYDCVLKSEGHALWAKDEVWSVSTGAEGVALPFWVYKYSLEFETWNRGQPVKAGECLNILRTNGL